MNMKQQPQTNKQHTVFCISEGPYAGIYFSWNECYCHVRQAPHSIHGFANLSQAQAFMNRQPHLVAPPSSQWYTRERNPILYATTMSPSIVGTRTNQKSKRVDIVEILDEEDDGEEQVEDEIVEFEDDDDDENDATMETGTMLDTTSRTTNTTNDTRSPSKRQRLDRLPVFANTTTPNQVPSMMLQPSSTSSMMMMEPTSVTSSTPSSSLPITPPSATAIPPPPLMVSSSAIPSAVPSTVPSSAVVLPSTVSSSSIPVAPPPPVPSATVSSSSVRVPAEPKEVDPFFQPASAKPPLQKQPPPPTTTRATTRKKTPSPNRTSDSSSEDSTPPLHLLDTQQRRALQAFQEGHNIFLTGVAGTGKSYVTQLLFQLATKRYGEHRVGLAAPTGMAAVQLANAQTIHTLFGLSIPSKASDFNKIRKEVKQRVACMDCCILDEIGMVPAELLDWLDVTLRKIRRVQDKVFGGMQLIWVGDFCQLGPVPGSIRLHQQTPYPPDHPSADCWMNLHECTAVAFQSAAWRQAKLVPVHLKTVYRQQGKGFHEESGTLDLRDGAFFVRALQDIRQQRPTTERVQQFVQACSTPLQERHQVDLPPGLLPTCLYTTNFNADRENAECLARLQTPSKVFVAIDSVHVHPEVPISQRKYVYTQLERNTFFQQCLAVKHLELKVGAQVMLLQNHPVDKRLVNGSRGVVQSFRLCPKIQLRNSNQEQFLGPDEYESDFWVIEDQYNSTSSSSSSSQATTTQEDKGQKGTTTNHPQDTVSSPSRGGRSAPPTPGTPSRPDPPGILSSESPLAWRSPPPTPASPTRNTSTSTSTHPTPPTPPPHNVAWKDLKYGMQLCDNKGCHWKIVSFGKFPWVEFVGNGNDEDAPVSKEDEDMENDMPFRKRRSRPAQLILPTTHERTMFRQGDCRRLQLPLRLSWALTVHKAQGCSLDWLICDLAGCFASGQAYVALSRARSMAGLQIRNFQPKSVKTDPLVDAFYQALAEEEEEYDKIAATPAAMRIQHPTTTDEKTTTTKGRRGRQQTRHNNAPKNHSQIHLSKLQRPTNGPLESFLEHQAGLWWYPLLDHPEWLAMFRNTGNPNATYYSKQFREWVANYEPDKDYSGWRGYPGQPNPRSTMMTTTATTPKKTVIVDGWYVEEDVVKKS
eukprot:Nitzschia sp. Nitz4//scaffold115_size69933//38129//41566//NITZ4_006005-RA/size69933-processed-gene-0.119-mRNA-1//-1//CDS//3329533508//2821//frame0